jgi:hypothetical protein
LVSRTFPPFLRVILGFQSARQTLNGACLSVSPPFDQGSLALKLSRSLNDPVLVAPVMAATAEGADVLAVNASRVRKPSCLIS